MCSECEAGSETFHDSKHAFIMLNHSIKYKRQAAISPPVELSWQQESPLGHEDMLVDIPSFADVDDVSISNTR